MSSGKTSVPSDPAADTSPSILLRRSGDTARTQAVIEAQKIEFNLSAG